MKQEVAVNLGLTYGGLAGAGYAYWTGALLALKTASAAQLTSVGAFLFSSPLPLSVVLPVVIPVATGVAVGGGISYVGYQLYGMLSSSQNRGQNQAPVGVVQPPQAGP